METLFPDRSALAIRFELPDKHNPGEWLNILAKKIAKNTGYEFSKSSEDRIEQSKRYTDFYYVEYNSDGFYEARWSWD